MDFIRILQVALGIGLVIFVHELGHFLAARWCGVRVHVFSLGFGPRLIGWRRGQTMYQISAVPLGGYVSMAGEMPDADGAAPPPDDLRAKSVGQRFLIFSGGVLMNVAFGLVVFPLVFMAGVPFNAPVIDTPAPGSPAWVAGLEGGTRIESIDGTDVLSFMDISLEVALGGPEPVELVVRDPGAEQSRTVFVDPQMSETLGAYTIRVRPTVDPQARVIVRSGGAAAAAGLNSGDRLLGVVGQPQELPSWEQVARAQNAEGTLALRVADATGQEREVSIEPDRSEQTTRPLLGVFPLFNRVTALRANPILAELDLEVGDRVVSIAGTQVAGAFDFERGLLAADGELELALERDGLPQTRTLARLTRPERLQLASDLALGQDTESTLVAVRPESAAALAGLLDGDRVLAVNDAPVDTWEALNGRISEAARAGRSLALQVERSDPASGERTQLELEASPAPVALADWGFGFEPNQYIFKTNGPLESIRVGLHSSWKMIEDAWLTLKRMMMSQISTENIGGIISISAVSYSFAESGLPKLFYFLCLLSLNLAFINVLPIPMLDGGHLLFLLVEKIKGSPVSERIVGYSQMVGLVLLVGLMVYVTYNDIMRFLPGGA